MDEFGSPPDNGPDTTAASGQYVHLVERAEAFVRGKGGVASEEALIGFVFGGAGSASLWQSLLRTMLANQNRLVLRSDGHWVVPSQAAPTQHGLLDRFVAIDVETTGLRPTTQRVIEVAAIRFEAGTESERFETLVNPGRAVPKFISDLTGIRDDQLEGAPPFERIAARLESFVGDAVLVGHNIDFDISFVNAELRRCGRLPWQNPRIDTLGLATRLMPQVRRPGLQSVAQRLSIPRLGREHRAGADAELSAAVALRLAEQAGASGFTSEEEFRALGAPAERRPGERAPRSKPTLDRTMLRTVPHAPGVYIMWDQFDRIIYIGKAKDLRDRVGSYFSQPLGYTRKMDGLLESLDRIEVEVVGSELEALLLESQLIRRYQPRYNRALRSHEQYPFIRVDIANPWPRISLAKARKADGARYFGPFRNANAARQTVDLLNRVVPLRTCTRSFKDARSYGAPCLELDLGRCLGPCVHRADRDRYQSLVRDVVAFLDGRDEALYGLLHAALNEAASALDFERAARLRREIQLAGAVVGTQRRLRSSAEDHARLLVLPSAQAGSRELLLVAGGRAWARFRAEEDGEAAGLAARLSLSWARLVANPPPAVDHDTVDDAHILDRFLALHDGHPAVILCPAPPASVDWLTVAQRALSLPEEALSFEMPGGEDDESAGVASAGSQDEGSPSG